MSAQARARNVAVPTTRSAAKIRSSRPRSFRRSAAASVSDPGGANQERARLPVPVFFTSNTMRLPRITVLALLLAGCAAAPAPRHALPALPAAFKEAPQAADWIAAPDTAQAQGSWWSVFRDPDLDQLVDQADRHNASIELAAANLAQARAALHGAEAQRTPQVDLRASGAREGGPLINAAGTDGNLFGASASL